MYSDILWPARARNRFSHIFLKFGRIFENKPRNLSKLTNTSLQTPNEGRLNFKRGRALIDIFVHLLLRAAACKNRELHFSDHLVEFLIFRLKIPLD